MRRHTYLTSTTTSDDWCFDDLGTFAWDDYTEAQDPILASMHVEAMFAPADEDQDAPAITEDLEVLTALVIEALAWQADTTPGTAAHTIACEAVEAAWNNLDVASLLAS
jgi:hypothetical protein